MNGLAVTIVVGQLPKLCGSSTDADGFVDEVRAFVSNSTSATPPRWPSAWAPSPCCSSCPA
jgi:MFS superfamily sulfate permease-like transporter